MKTPEQRWEEYYCKASKTAFLRHVTEAFEDGGLARLQVYAKECTLAREAGRKDENEACALTCEQYAPDPNLLYPWMRLAEFIRARMKPEPRFCPQCGAKRPEKS